ncbi:MAG: XdhC family protein [Oscillospiraceae bacterium]|nr:XdhC family protein [Oscillospiraceae bacterium]
MLNKLKEVYRAVAEGKEAALTFTADGEEYLRSFHPPERLILLGCGNIGQELCRYAADLGFTVTAVDERPAFANRTLMPDAAEILCSDFPDAIRRLQITERNYVCVITRGHRFDADCLREILPGAYPRYLGMIGSKRRVALLMKQLESEGFGPDALKRIHAPIGISINALTVKEIAISIVAELIQCRRAGLDRRSKETRLTAEDIDLRLLEFLTCDDVPKALLLVYETSGSTPVKSGAMMAVDKVGRTVGTIGGGCGEGAVLKDAYRIIGSGTQCTVTVDMSNDIAEAEGMVCGGEMKVLIADVSP